MQTKLSLLLLLSASCQAPPPHPARTVAPFVQARLDDLRAEHGFPGATVGVVFPDGESLSFATGFAEPETRRPLRPNDLMLAGSIGKSYVAAVTLQCVGEGRLELEQPLATWFADEPWFDELPNGRDLTLRMLLQHRSGVPEHVLLPEFWETVNADPDREFAPAELIAFILGKEPLFPADTAFSYADTNYVLVGMILERVTGRTWFELLEERVLAPLALTDTVPSASRRIPGLVPGHLAADNPFGWPATTIVDGQFVIHPGSEWTGGGVASTGLDLARWAHALFRGGFLAPELLAHMTAGRRTNSQRAPGRYGMGTQIRESDLGVTWGHGGWFPGYLSEMAYFPDYGLAVGVQVNTDDPERRMHPRELLLELAPLLLGGRAQRRVPAGG